ncbi:hypothetical protein FGADI_1952 [Fusarium gaditjirri]|uniref:Uncharacterized protein n=1 Tax=Fusarium gaditjirri TaxID=282569 RepID=A0A8H4X2V5_9HYPO|nr:hypothetical protein FGADI_1952 [Fusarium gaditjirri]
MEEDSGFSPCVSAETLPEEDEDIATAPTSAAASATTPASTPASTPTCNRYSATDATTVSTLPSSPIGIQDHSTTRPSSDTTGAPDFATGSNRIYIAKSWANKRSALDHGDLSPRELSKKIRLDLQGSYSEPLAAEPETAASTEPSPERRILRPRPVPKPVAKPAVTRASKAQSPDEPESDSLSSSDDEAEEEKIQDSITYKEKKKSSVQATLFAYCEMFKAAASRI